MKKHILLIIILAVFCVSSSVMAADYIVKHGDTLSGIAKSQLGNANRWPEIAKWNGLKHPYMLRVGQKLKLPQPQKKTEVKTVKPSTKTVKPVEKIPEEIPADFKLPSQTWLWSLIGLFLSWIFTSVCLRWGCWFSLVETTFVKCMLLAFLLAGILLLTVFVIGGIGFLVIRQEINPVILKVSSVIGILGYIAATVIVTKRILLCKWRSLVTIMIMSKVVADLITIGIIIILFFIIPQAMGAEAIQELINAIVDIV